MTDTTNYLKHKDTNPIQKVLIENFYNKLYALLRPLKPTSILDVGSGEGFTLRNLEEKGIGERLEGIDYSDDAIKLAKKIYPTLTIKKGDIYSLPYEDSSFDVLLCTEVLEHLRDPEKAIAELKRVSKKHIIFSVPNEPFFILANFLRGKYLKRFGNHPEHINHWSARGFKKFLKKNDLEIQKSRHPFAWTLILAKKK